MEIATVVELVSSFGLPIALVIAMGWFIYKIYMQAIDREDRLHEYLNKYRDITAEAITTIAKYSDRLDVIQEDVKVIKEDIAILASTVHETQ